MQTAIAKFPFMPASKAMARAAKESPEIIGKIDPPRQPKFRQRHTRVILRTAIIIKYDASKDSKLSAIGCS